MLEKRIFAFLIDIFIIAVPNYAIAFIFWDYIFKNKVENIITISLIIQFAPFLLYFFISELFFNKTIGKHFQDLEVVITSNKFFSILVRTICRLIPLDLLTFFFFNDKLLHDVLSKTSVTVKS